MKEVLLSLPGIALTVVCWGAYGSVLHKGQHFLNENRLKPLICVGLAYFVVAIIVPSIVLAMHAAEPSVAVNTLLPGQLGGDWTVLGVSWSMAAGAAGALGALGIILALTSGGKPVYVMPLVFGGAPIINVFVSMYFQGISYKDINPIFIAGMIMVLVGAVVVLVFKPSPPKPPHAQAAAAARLDPGSAAEPVQDKSPEAHHKSTPDTSDSKE